MSLSAIALLAVLVGGAAYSPLMAVRKIEVTGTSRVPAADVAAALDDQLGTPLPLVDVARIKNDLSAFVLIRSFVTESRPPGTLVVRIVERQPVGVISAERGFNLVDAAGVVIESHRERPKDYPTIKATGGVRGDGFRAATGVITALPDNIRLQLETATAATNDDVTLTLRGGATVVWGSAEKSAYKAVVLAALMVGHPTDSVNEYDVSSPDNAVLR